MQFGPASAGPKTGRPSSQHGQSDEMAATRLPARVAAILFPFVREMFAVGPNVAYPDGVERGTVVFEEQLVQHQDEEAWTPEDGDNFAGWFCVRTNPFPCPADGCTYVADFMTAAHLILVWQDSDDPNLLKHAARARDVGRNPRIVGYESDYGPSASYYAWIAAGRPVHGVRAQ